ncbi:MAG: cysteine synthase CysM [Magnetococcales bacterium]|nr:cysteine synthase CysM [Magnetococcales bacterium]NGZ29068.1 cysteine synthase CysM [Magnetococcales bacterium]
MSTLESCIGNTPLVDLNRMLPSSSAVKVLVKLEGSNPGGSVKDRTAFGLFMGAESRGELQAGVRIVEPTSGNTGIALAMLAARRGYKLTLVMPESMTVERRAVMAAYGAHIDLTPASLGMEGSIDRAREIVANEKKVIMFDQFSNPDNWRIHYRTTGPEVWEGTSGRITHFVSAMGTTGTIMGVSRYLKERNSSIRIIGVQPDDYSRIPGIRRWPQEYLPKIYEPGRVDKIMDVSEDEAKEAVNRLAREEGIFCGLSAGGAVAAALRLARSIQESGVIVVILPDRGDRYLSTDIFR